MKSIGLDLSLTGTGVVVLNDGKLDAQTSIKSSKTGKKHSDEIERLRTIVSDIMEYVDEHKPDVAVIEGIAFMAKNTTALAQLAGLNYMVRSALVDRDIPFLIVAPTSLKKFVTGSGNAPKDTIMLEIYKRWHVTLLDNNIADAYALAQVGLAVSDSERKITKFQKEVIDLISTQI